MFGRQSDNNGVNSPRITSSHDGEFNNSDDKPLYLSSQIPPDTASLISVSFQPGTRAWTRQFLAAVAACTGGLSIGLCMGWSSPAIKQLQGGGHFSKISPFAGKITEYQAGWIGASLSLGAIVQVLVTGMLMNFFGRRISMILSSFPLVAGWLMIGLASNIWHIYFGRALTGFSAGLLSVLVPVYIGEISSPNWRGVFGTVFQVFIVLGILLMYSVGIYVHWSILAVIAVAVPVVTMLLAMLYLPESPTWLVSICNVEQATDVVIWLRDQDFVLEEMENLMESTISLNDSPYPSPPWYKDSTKVKPVVLIFLVMLINQLCGISVVETFFQSMFNWSDPLLPASFSSSIVGGCMLLATFLAGPVVKHVDRRPLLTFSLIVMCISMFGFGTYVYLLPARPYNSVPLVCMFLYATAYSIGIGPLAWVLLGDLALPKVSSAVVTVASLTNWGTAFILISFFSSLTKLIGLAGIWWAFSSLSLLGCLILILVLPETRGLSTSQIINLFL